jgi:hypothetical protein
MSSRDLCHSVPRARGHTIEMSKQAAKHHRKAARRERAERRVKRVGGGKPTRAKKLVTRDEHAVGEAYARPAPDTVEVMEIEVVRLPRRLSGSGRGRTLIARGELF